MNLLEKFMKIRFILPDGRSLEEYYKTVGLVGKIGADDIVKPSVFPEVGVKVSSYDGVLKYFVEGSQFAKEAKAAFNQKNNSQTPSELMYLYLIEQKADETLTEAMNKAKQKDGRFIQFVPISRDAEDILLAADWALTNDRFVTFVVTDVDAVKTLVATQNDYAYGIFRKNANEPIASAVASCSTSGHFGSSQNSPQFTQLVGIMPETYEDDEYSAMDTNNIAYYVNVAPVDGGQTESMGYNWIVGANMLGGGDKQRTNIIHYLKKGLSLLHLEFFNTKPDYAESGNNTLLHMYQGFFRSCQIYGLIIKDSEDLNGFYVGVTPIRTGEKSIKKTNTEAYAKKAFVPTAYCYDAITGKFIDLSCYVDPTDDQIETILGKAA